MAEGKILPYLDIPFQHASPRVLKAMRRPAADAKTLERIRSWRAAVPGLTLRSSFIVGFPGETDEDFDYLLDWLDEAELDRVGCFRYEPVTGAASNALPNAVPEPLIEERWHALMAAQQAISARRLARRVGTTLEVIVDRVEEDRLVARSWGDAPEIDGNVFLPADPNLAPGTILEVHVEEADAYDLWGAPLRADRAAPPKARRAAAETSGRARRSARPRG
jgi:ribosomal protein S12 methylthiotransferase